MSIISTGLESLIPVTILTGFLGSGKTTLLNHLVRDPAMARTLVVINEFGSVGLDHELIAPAKEELMVEMMGGCLCCTIRGDLLRVLRDAPFRFARDGQCWFDRLVIETTGLADPAPILHTLMSDHHLQTLYRLDGIITTVDASTGLHTLETQEESRKQIAVADRLLLTKSDLAEAQDMARLTARLAELNPVSPILHAHHGHMQADQLLEIGLFNPATKSADVARWLNEEAHTHHHQHDHDVNRHGPDIHAFCITFDEALDGIGFDRWIGAITQFMGPQILRLKGIVNIKDCAAPLVIHGVQHVLHAPVALDRWPSQDRRTRLVFILKDASEADIRSTLPLLRQAVQPASAWQMDGPSGLIEQGPAYPPLA